jgi:hypothetical protein
VGWVSFEPTPGVGSATAFKEPGSTSSTTDSGDSTNNPRSSVREETNQVDSTATKSSTDSQTAPRTALITFIVLVVLVGVPALLRWVRRRWRFSRGRTSVDPLWRELEDTARDFGLPFSPTDTPRGFATRLGTREGIDHDALDRLLKRVERARFARTPIEEGDGSGDLRAIIASFATGASRQERWRAVALPRSLSGRRAFAPSSPLPNVASTLG